MWSSCGGLGSPCLLEEVRGCVWWGAPTAVLGIDSVSRGPGPVNTTGTQSPPLPLHPLAQILEQYLLQLPQQYTGSNTVN